MAVNHTLNGFIAKLKQTGLALSSHYLVNFSDPLGGDVSMMIDSINMPGISIMTTEMRTFGEIINTPYLTAYEPVQLTVLVDNTGSAIDYFHNWANKVFNRTTRYLGFKEEYARDVTITLEDRKDNKIYKLHLEGAYPISVSSIPLDYSNHDIVKLSVTLTYDRWSPFEPGIEELTDQERPIALENRIQALRMQAMGDRVSRINARDFGNPNDIGRQYQVFGPEMAASIGRANSTMQAALKNKPLIGADGTDQSSNFSRYLGNLTGNFVRMGEGIRDLGRGLNDVVAPVRAISDATSAISSTLGSIDNMTQQLGLGRPFTRIRQQMNGTAGDLYRVSTLGGVPRHMGTIGANMNGMGNVFGQISGSLRTATNGTERMTGAMRQMSQTYQTQGTNLNNSSSNLQTYVDNNP